MVCLGMGGMPVLMILTVLHPGCNAGLTVWGNLQYQNTACFLLITFFLWLGGGQEAIVQVNTEVNT